MRYFQVLDEITRMLRFRSIYDGAGNEYVVYAHDRTFEGGGVKTSKPIEDRTGFEAVHNHEHFGPIVRDDDDVELLKPIVETLADMMLLKLKASYPQKDFCVYISLKKYDNLIIRFHQVWAGELPYYEMPWTEEGVYLVGRTSCADGFAR